MMEKRLFLAIFLSLGVVFVFQTMFPPVKQTANTTQVIDSKAVVSNQTAASPALAPIGTATAVKQTFTEDLITLENARLRAVFTNKGGSIAHLEVKDLKYALPTRNYLAMASYDQSKFEATKVSAAEIVYTLQDPEWQIRKTYKLDERKVLCRIELKNVSKGKISLLDGFNAFTIDISSLDISEQKSDWTLFEYSIGTDKNIIRKGSAQNFNDKWNKEEQKPVKWFGFRDRYFATIVKPEFEVGAYSIKATSDKELSLGTMLSNINVPVGESLQYDLIVFAGPQDLKELSDANKDFAKIMAFSDWGWLDAIAKAIHWMLGMLHKLIPSWGICIILGSFIIYALMYPLTLKSLVSMRKMQAVQPKVKALQEKYKKSPEKLNQEIMQLYKENNVNPLSGCLPMLLQMPIFVGLYQVLWRSIYFRGESFLWIKDLSMPDRLIKLPFTIPFLGEYFNILPILMTAIMVLQQKITTSGITMTDPEQAAQQKMMAIIFPVMIGFIFYNFASGLNVYFVIFYALSAGTQWKISQDVKATA